MDSTGPELPVMPTGGAWMTGRGGGGVFSVLGEGVREAIEEKRRERASCSSFWSISSHLAGEGRQTSFPFLSRVRHISSEKEATFPRCIPVFYLTLSFLLGLVDGLVSCDTW